jgi:hypothetical protein
MRRLTLKTELCVIGGGPAGIACALAAARTGIETVLIQDRPVLGGNCSSEIRVGISGAQSVNYPSLGIKFYPENRETGIVEELQLENLYYNRELKFSYWDHILLFKMKSEPNITLLLNCVCLDALCNKQRIESVTAYQASSETWYILQADYFADCSGDSILAPLTGAAYMMGHESKKQFGENLGKEEADSFVMGMSILLQARETSERKAFIPPPWAYKFTESDLEGKIHTINRSFWWIEYGGNRDVIHEGEEIRDELLKIAYGVWDHMKNTGNHGLENWELEWIGSIPGRRESRRYIGKYIITQNDVETGGLFEDIVAYGGWTMDSHFPEGFYHSGRITENYPAPSPWGISLRSLYHRDIENLVFAGRNLSATHLGMSSARIMGQCFLMGQAIGTAVALALKSSKTLDTLDIGTLQQELMFNDCWLPGKYRNVSALTMRARTNVDLTRDGIDRGEEHCWKGQRGDYIELAFDIPQDVKGIRLVFDSNLTRTYHHMPGHYPLGKNRIKLPPTLVKEYRISALGEQGKEYEIVVTDNYQRLVFHRVDWKIVRVRLEPLTSWGAAELRVFGFEIFQEELKHGCHGIQS